MWTKALSPVRKATATPPTSTDTSYGACISQCDQHANQPSGPAQYSANEPPAPTHLARQGDWRTATVDRDNPPQQIFGAHGRVRVRQGVTTGDRGFARHLHQPVDKWPP